MPFDGDGMREYLVDEYVRDSSDPPLVEGLKAGSLLEVPRGEVSCRRSTAHTSVNCHARGRAREERERERARGGDRQIFCFGFRMDFFLRPWTNARKYRETYISVIPPTPLPCYSIGGVMLW